MVRNPDGDWVLKHHLDITGTINPVELVFDRRRKVLHVNVEGICLLRICRAEFIHQFLGAEDAS